MEAIKPQTKGTKRLFKNPVLEKLTRTHISVPLVIFFSYSSALLYWSITHTSLSILATVAMFMVGLIAFTWVEDMMHRYLFHMVADTAQRAKVQYTLHGVHHEFPKAKEGM